MRIRGLWRYHALVPKGVTPNFSQSPNSLCTGTSTFRRTEAAVMKADADEAAKGFFFLPKIDFPLAHGVPPLISRDQFMHQYEVWHRDAVDTLNELVLGSDVEGHSLDTVIRHTSFDATRNALHTAACEHFNYCFFYKSLRPWGTAVPPQLKDALQLQLVPAETNARGSAQLQQDGVAVVRSLMLHAALSLQDRLGWVYLIWNGQALDVVAYPHGTCPLAHNVIPLLAINVHESAYALDYDMSDPNSTQNYVTNYFKACNWGLAGRNYVNAIVGDNFTS